MPGASTRLVDSSVSKTIPDEQYQIATVSDDGVFISESRSSETEWKFAEGLRGYGAQEQ